MIHLNIIPGFCHLVIVISDLKRYEVGSHTVIIE